MEVLGPGVQKGPRLCAGVFAVDGRFSFSGLALSVTFGDTPGLRHPASASCFEKHLRLAGRGPNNDSLFPPLAAVIIVAPKGGAKSLSLWERWQR